MVFFARRKNPYKGVWLWTTQFSTEQKRTTLLIHTQPTANLVYFLRTTHHYSNPLLSSNFLSNPPPVLFPTARYKSILSRLFLGVIPASVRRVIPELHHIIVLLQYRTLITSVLNITVSFPSSREPSPDRNFSQAYQAPSNCHYQIVSHCSNHSIFSSNIVSVLTKSWSLLAIHSPHRILP